MKYRLRILQLPESLKKLYGPGVQWAFEEVFHDNLIAVIDFQNCKRHADILIGAESASVIAHILPDWIKAERNSEGFAEFTVEILDKEGNVCEAHGIKDAYPNAMGQENEDGTYRFTLNYDLK